MRLEGYKPSSEAVTREMDRRMATVNPVFKVAPVIKDASLLLNFFLGPDFTNSPKAKPVIKVAVRLLKLCGCILDDTVTAPNA